jgi:hypothetical protein
MRKYRRFVENLKESGDRGGALGVRNACLAQFLESLPAASIGRFGQHGFSFGNEPSPSCHATTGFFR